MPVFDLFSKRQKRLRGEVPDVYSYDKLPDALRVQIVHIVLGAMGNVADYRVSVASNYKSIVNVLRREYGVFRLLANGSHDDRGYLGELVDFFLRETNIDRSLDVIELCFQTIDTGTRDFQYLHRRNASAVADDAICELNQRFNLDYS